MPADQEMRSARVEPLSCTAPVEVDTECIQIRLVDSVRSANATAQNSTTKERNPSTLLSMPVAGNAGAESMDDYSSELSSNSSPRLAPHTFSYDREGRKSVPFSSGTSATAAKPNKSVRYDMATISNPHDMYENLVQVCNGAQN